MDVIDCMSRTAALRPDQESVSAFALMQEQGFDRLPVVDGEGTIVGVLARAHAQRAISRYASVLTEVADIMDAGPTPLTAATPLSTAARRMLAEHAEALPVVDADGRLIGLLTAGDLHHALLSLLRGDSGVSDHAA